MVKRKIIEIDEEKCTGCGLCIPDCPEGALQVIEGKARLVSDLFCDGLGACIGTCPEGAIRVVEREAGPYDERAVMAKIVPQGEAVIRAHLEHLLGHGEEELYRQAVGYLTEHAVPVPSHSTPGAPAACPGSAVRTLPDTAPQDRGTMASELRQWPIQLSLVNPAASYFDDADLLVSGDCVPFAYAGFHRDFLRGRVLLLFCPKLDADIEGYVAKLAEIFSRHTIRSVTVLHMEVPCCGGVRHVVDRALQRSGKAVPVEDRTIMITGRVAAEGEVTHRGCRG
ncbi:4Fe-4S ferredoxin iron-sulfur binding domain-containing protein [Methanofollis liminatans DSM 4140]|uniref:4Fe-4S ferredoxin iron-sulfur binding domain-containing protein n=1 Tax=Methanofollis liminatans DSM 4140 TaxID=28892 RepID=J0S187_9EURY|nr:4Fe-4S ferredoxin iron-sulfur binding domain-containing protein [Methanofollis liminatans DSM 4140]